MNQHVTFHVHLHNAHCVLQRVLLMFSRRRLRIRALHMFDVNDQQPAELQIDLSCTQPVARDLTAQLAKVVEIRQVWCEFDGAQLKPKVNDSSRPARQVA